MMAFYEYICNNCGRKFEAEQSIYSNPGAACPQCNSVTRHRLISKIGSIIFRGSDWASKEKQMMYRIFTEDKNLNGIKKILNKLFNGYTILEAQGMWKGEEEDSLIIEIDSLGQEPYCKVRVLQAADEIKELNDQIETMIQEICTNSL